MTITNAEAHRIAREKGVSGPLYLLVKYTAALVFRLLCGFTATGKENVPKKGPVVIVPNHKSFWDPFFVAIVLRRPVTRRRWRRRERSCAVGMRWRCSRKVRECVKKVSASRSGVPRGWRSKPARRSSRPPSPEPRSDAGRCRARSA